LPGASRPSGIDAMAELRRRSPTRVAVSGRAVGAAGVKLNRGVAVERDSVAEAVVGVDGEGGEQMQRKGGWAAGCGGES